jgi:predicted PurR-regulated permease PerM
VTIRLRVAFLVFVGVLLLWFLWLERAILTPFILAAIFAYIVNPVVNFFTHKIKLPRTLSVIIIYITLISIVVYFGVLLTSRGLSESDELKNYIQSIVNTTRAQVVTLPIFLQPAINEGLIAIQKSRFFSPLYLFEFFPQAISRIISFIIFVFSAFYFLKDGRSMFDSILHIIPKDYRIEVEILAKKINAALGGYLRGQLLLVVIVSALLFISLSIIGVRFALIIAIFSGFAEIIPFVGPIVAGGVAALVVFVTAINNFNLPPLSAAFFVAATYFVVRQFQDYFITPYVMGRITKLHPLVILFAVIAGGNLGGMMGLILAVPIAAVIRILLEYSMDKINEQKEELESVETLTV